MKGLYWLVTITDRNAGRRFAALYRRHGVDVTLSTAGVGTAVSETLDYLGLERTGKAVLLSVVTGDTWAAVKRSLEREVQIDIPGTGVAFTIPLSSIGGKRTLQFLTEHQQFVLGEESTLKETEYELLVVIADQGYSGLVMDAARSRGAGGGTVLHAKGTGMERAEQFLGVSLVSEKELVLIVVHRDQKNAVMRAVMDRAGTGSDARGIVFSLPVTGTAGMRLTGAEPAAE